jgi:hypothetical protein
MVKRYTVKRTESETTPTDDPFLYGPREVVLATDFEALSTRHARAIEALRGCKYAMEVGGEWHAPAQWENALAAARAVLEETP